MRRTIISTMCMAAAVVLAASCNKIEDDIVSVEGNGRTVINGVAEAIGGGTKAYNEYSYIVKWNEYDQIYVTNGTGYDTFTLTNGQDTPVGIFTEDNDKGISGNIEAFYPASLHTASGDYVWPATQSNNQVAPMYAKQSISGTANEVVSFSSLGGMLQIVFNTKTEGITVTSITLQSNKKPLSGKFTVDENGQAIMAENSENPGIILNLGTGVEMGSSAKYFYLAIPAGTYSTPEKDEVMTITFWDEIHDKKCVMTSTTFPEVRRNTVGRITLAKDFTDYLPFVINGHAYVELAGKKWATENVGYCKDVTAVAGPDNSGNGWGFYFYTQSNAPGAAQSWGSETDARLVTHSWKLPSESQWQALIDECYWEWTGAYNNLNSPYNGMSGYIVYEARDGDNGGLNKTNSGYTPATDTHIFLPAAGSYDYHANVVGFQNTIGYYWSTYLDICLESKDENRRVTQLSALDGMAVRPVSE